MNTQLKLNKKEELICKIKALPDTDVYLLKIFISGMEAERSIKRNCENKKVQAVRKEYVVRYISKLFVMLLGKKRQYFTTAIQHKKNIYVVTVEKYHPVKEFLQRCENIKK